MCVCVVDRWGGRLTLLHHHRLCIPPIQVGGREPLIVDYDVGFDDAGKVTALALKVYMEVCAVWTRARVSVCWRRCVG